MNTGAMIDSGDEAHGAATLSVVETAATAAAARAKAVVEARYVVAIKRPRNVDEVRVRLLKECQRPQFAEVAKYEKPVGGTKIVGFSVRFAEAAIRLAGNIAVDAFTIFDDPTRRIVRVEVVDLETNTPYGQDIPIEKTVERSKAGPDREIIATRKNTQGRTVYIVAATEDEFANKQNAAISKVIRNLGLRLIPGDILEECSQRIDETYRNKAAKDPEAEKKKVIDAFATLGVKPSQLAAYLEHELDAVVPAEITQLRRIYESIRDGETTWTAIMEEKFGEGAGGGTDGAAADERPRPKRKSEAAPTQEGPPAAATETKPAAEEPKAEKGAGEAAPPASAAKPEGRAQPPKGTGDKSHMAIVARIYKLMPDYNRKNGDGAAVKVLEQDYRVRSVAKLTPEQAAQFLAHLEAHAG